MPFILQLWTLSFELFLVCPYPFSFQLSALSFELYLPATRTPQLATRNSQLAPRLNILQQTVGRRYFHLLSELLEGFGQRLELLGVGNGDVVAAIQLDGIDNKFNGKGIDITGRLIAEFTIPFGTGFGNHPAFYEIVEDAVNQANGHSELM